MIDRKQVMWDIERCISHVPDACRDCSHYDAATGNVVECMEKLLTNAYAVLKEQEPRVMNILEVFARLRTDRINREPFAVEIKNGFCAWMISDSAMDLPETDLRDVLYGKTWRCWTAKPTEEQRKAVAWGCD